MWGFLAQLLGRIFGGLWGTVVVGLTSWFVIALPSLIWKAVAVLGIGFVSFSGIDLITDELGVFIAAQLAGFPADMLQIMNLAGFSTGLNSLLAGVSVFFTLKIARGASGFFRPNPNVLRA